MLLKYILILLNYLGILTNLNLSQPILECFRDCAANWLVTQSFEAMWNRVVRVCSTIRWTIDEQDELQSVVRAH